MKVYISGPMTGLPDYNFPAFAVARDKLRSEGIGVICPAEAGQITGATWADYLRRDLELLFRADAVVVLPGWQMSKGARLEVHVARELGMPVVDYVNSAYLAELTQ